MSASWGGSHLLHGPAAAAEQVDEPESTLLRANHEDGAGAGLQGVCGGLLPDRFEGRDWMQSAADADCPWSARWCVHSRLARCQWGKEREHDDGLLTIAAVRGEGHVGGRVGASFVARGP